MIKFQDSNLSCRKSFWYENHLGDLQNWFWKIFTKTENISLLPFGKILIQNSSWDSFPCISRLFLRGKDSLLSSKIKFLQYWKILSSLDLLAVGILFAKQKSLFAKHSWFYPSPYFWPLDVLFKNSTFHSHSIHETKTRNTQHTQKGKISKSGFSSEKNFSSYS